MTQQPSDSMAEIERLEAALEEFRFAPVTYAEPKIRTVYEAAKAHLAALKAADKAAMKGE